MFAAAPSANHQRSRSKSHPTFTPRSHHHHKRATTPQIDNGKTGTGSECKKIAALAAHLPSRFRLNGDASGVLGCAWPVSATAARCAVAGAALVLGGVSLGCALVRRSRWAAVVGLLLAAAGAGLGYATYTDATLVAASRAWCRAGMPGMPFAARPRSVDCRYTWPVLTACADAAAAAVLVVLAWASTCYACKAGPRPRRPRRHGGAVGTERALLINGGTEDEEAPDRDAETDAGETRFGPADDDDDEGARGRGGVDFESVSRARYAPMSRTDRDAAQKKGGKKGVAGKGGKDAAAAAPAPCPEGMFDFDSVESDSKATPGAEPAPVASATASAVPKPQSAAPAPAPQTQPKQQPQPQQPQPQVQQQQPSGYIDFDSLAGNDAAGF